MARAGRFGALLVVTVACLLPAAAPGQGETTSAIVGQVRDTTNAVVLGATVTIANSETGFRRSAQTDETFAPDPFPAFLVRALRAICSQLA